MSLAETDAQTRALVDALAQVHDGLGPHHADAAYREAFALELMSRGIAFRRDAVLPVWYKGIRLAAGHPVAFLCHGHVVVEPRGGPILRRDEVALHNVLRGTRSSVGMLASLGGAHLEVRRVVRDGALAAVDTLLPEPDAAPRDDPQPSSGAGSLPEM